MTWRELTITGMTDACWPESEAAGPEAVGADVVGEEGLAAPPHAATRTGTDTTRGRSR